MQTATVNKEESKPYTLYIIEQEPTENKLYVIERDGVNRVSSRKNLLIFAFSYLLMLGLFIYLIV